MEKIDFYYDKRDLHRKMYDAIAQLVKMTKDGIVEIDNSDDCLDRAYAYFEPDGYSSVHGFEVDAVKYDEFLTVHNEEFSTRDTYTWFYIDGDSDAVWCSIDTIYDAVWNAIVNSDEFELIKHGEGEWESEYLCRYVHSHDVGITDIDDDILIAPEALLDSINVLDHGENEEIDKKVYYYASDDIMDLPYKEFCDKLKESGID
ncbi:MAG: hypothetical protein MR717_09180 [Prevotella sp.]|nr:hypothetical protein [Prevotella sp.]